MAIPNPVNLLSAAYGHDIRTLEEKLDPLQVVNIVNAIKNNLDIENMTTPELNAVARYTANNLRNDKIKNLLLEIINLSKGRQRSSVPLGHVAKGDVFSGLIQARRLIAPGVDRAVLFAPAQNVADAENQLNNTIFDYQQILNRARLNILGGDRIAADAAVNFVRDADLIINRRHVKNLFTQAVKSRFDNLKANILTRAGTRQRRTNARQKTQAAGDIADLLTASIATLTAQVAPIGITGIPLQAPMPANLPTTKQNLKELQEDLKKQFKKAQKKDKNFVDKMAKAIKKGFAVHSPHAEHGYQNIRIYSDKIKKIKEIIIENHATGEDILKLSHSLVREDGVILDIEGNILFEVKKNQKPHEIITKIIQLIKNAKHGHFIRLIYKPNSPVGGHYVGGSFTDLLYNNTRILGRHVLTHKLVDHGFHNGFISPDINFLRSEIRHYK